jgi:hypothetical protein
MAYHGFPTCTNTLVSTIRLFDTSYQGKLNFEDFLKMVLSKENREIRHTTAMRSINEKDW